MRSALGPPETYLEMRPSNIPSREETRDDLPLPTPPMSRRLIFDVPQSGGGANPTTFETSFSSSCNETRIYLPQSQVFGVLS